MSAAGHVLGGGKDGSAPGRNGGRGRGRGGARGGRGGATQENGNATNPNPNPRNNGAAKHADPTAAAPAAGENRRRDGGRGGRNNRTTEAPQQQQNGQQNGNQRGGKPQQAAPAAVVVATPPAPFVATGVPENSAQKGKSDGKAFEALGLIAPLVRAVAEMGYINPSPVQLASIPKVLKEIDLLAGAQTGTGKTAAFSLPILQLLMRAYEEGKADPNVISVLCLTPTRELAAQIVDNVTQYFKYLTIGKNNKAMHCTVIFGGVSQGKQVEEIKNKKPQILVATPGRLLDLHGQGLLHLNNVKFLVLDEADRMLDMGFYPDVSKIIKLLPAKENRQTLLFSATFPEQIRSLSKTVLRTGAAEVQVTPPNTTVERIDQRYYLVGREKKRDLLLYLLKMHNWSQVLVFCRTKATSNDLTTWLNKHGVTASALHGSKSQTSRTAALGGFKEGTMKVLVATDIAARGIDIEDLPHVVNYEVPHVSEDYVHRIGRTGRAGKKGYAVNLVSLDEEGFMVNIIKSTKATIPLSNAADLPKTPDFGPANGERAEPIPQGKQPALWGGLGPAPSREYMQQVAKDNRREIARNMQDRKAEEKRVREEKAAGRGGAAPGSAPAAGRGGRGGGRGGRR